MEKIQELTNILRRIGAGEDLQILAQGAGDLLHSVGPKDLALAEQELLQSGYSVSDLQRLYAAEVQLFGDQLAKLKALLPANHIIHKLLVEHELINCFLADLEEVIHEIAHADYLSNTSTEFRKLTHIVGHLLATDEHKEIEDEIIFPQLETRGVYNPLQLVKAEHLCLDISLGELLELVASAHNMQLPAFKARLNQILGFFIPAMREHLFKEDNILFPIALAVLDDPQIWCRIKAICDEVGYCCLHSDMC